MGGLNDYEQHLTRQIWTWLRKENFKRETESLLIAQTRQRHKNQSYQSENR